MSTLQQNLTNLINAKNAIGTAITSNGGELSTGRLEGFPDDLNNRFGYINDYIESLLTAPPPPPPSSVTRQVNFVNETTSITDGSIEDVDTFAGIRRCNVADDGTINCFYGENSYTEDGSNGQVMVYIPKFYYKVNHTDSSGNALTNGAAIDIGNWSIADGALEGYTVHPAFINVNGDEVDYFLIGAFEAVFQNGSTYTSSYKASYKMASSKGSGSLTPSRSFTRANGRTTAQARGTGWYQIGIKQISAIQLLITVEYGCDSQASIGQGFTKSGYSNPTNVGQTIGNSTSEHSDNVSVVVYRGIENLWGNIWSWIDGLTMYGLKPYVYTGYSFTDSYSIGVQLSFDIPSAATITRFGYDSTFNWVFLPKYFNSSNSMINDIVDGVYFPQGTYISMLGGGYANATDAGLFNLNVTNSSSSTGSKIGSRLMYVPS